ncbi:regulator of Ty1 transposition protein, putative [Candida dubliniensis CD36]|uniref:Regulator of Ty1 transposition protein, putative n=1 Tax=Candida dubliniensis (strain CD36 / ATCC MYA-646 / CBS 7987 / NCPF 3949 / NRRL Y-17841) TaxID=573826 RepID=B9WN69_CANDC|nr:regulator of Ty1 transposition protein, putative [Candida dubliniensis CD36]CAX40536.1 regulator of Ty1 transposition protein, putative [Candida dubliniensis CD36]
MSFSATAFKNKLDTLSETQESIVSISQWVLFHQKYHKESATIWYNYIIQDSITPAKRLALLYLCNDVVQQARRKNKPEFINEFNKVLPGALNKDYANLRPKVDRLLNVWEERKIFTKDDIVKMKASLTAESKPSGSYNIAPELKHINDLFIHLNQLNDISQGNLTQMGIESKAYLNPQDCDTLPAPAVYISKLNTLEQLGNVCINNVDEIKKTRMKIKSQLDSLSKLIIEGTKTDDSKLAIINDKMQKIKETRSELNQENNDTNSENSADEEELPGYESESEEEGDTRKRRMSQTPSGGSTPSKRVAFSEDVEVFEDQVELDTAGNDKPETKESVSEDVMSLLSKLVD